MYNLIENFGSDMVLKDEQQGVEFFRLNKRLKELCELSFCEVEDENSD
jgi:hypothetical protein